MEKKLKKLFKTLLSLSVVIILCGCNNNSLLTKTEEYDWDGNSTSYMHVYEYDENGKPIKRYTYDEQTNAEISIATLDNKGRVIQTYSVN